MLLPVVAAATSLCFLNFVMERRRSIGEVGLKRRYGAMSTGEVLHERLCLLALSAILIVASDEDNAEEEEDLEIVVAIVAAELETLRIDRTVVRSVRGRDLVINDLHEDGAWVDYRFRKDDLRRLFTVLRIPDVWVCKNRSRFPGETALLLLLRRLRYAQRCVEFCLTFD